MAKVERLICTVESSFWRYPGPGKGEIVEVDEVVPFCGLVFYALKGYYEPMSTGERVNFGAKFFRPIDYTFRRKHL